MKLRVGMVARSLNVDHVRGTGRYVQEMLRHAGLERGIEWTALAHDPSRPLHLPQSFDGGRDVFDFKGDRLDLWEQIGLPLRLRRHGAQILHCADNTAPWWQPLPTIVTIHDAVPWFEPATDPLQHFYLHEWQPRAFRRCAAIITISENSRRDIETRWPELGRKIVVIPHGIAPEFFETALPCPSLPLQDALAGRPYLVYMGGPQPRKRFQWAVDLLMRCSRPELQLVACGFPSDPGQRPTLSPEVAQRVHFSPYIDDAELVALYRGAVAALYPTRYEGFGFPAIESQAAGTPVIFSPVSSLVDLVGPLSWAAPLDDFEGWRQALESVLQLPEAERIHRADLALKWSRSFSWPQSARAHVRLYEAVAHGECEWAHVGNRV